MAEKNDFYIDENGKVRLISSDERKQKQSATLGAVDKRPVYRGEGALGNTKTMEAVRPAAVKKQSAPRPAGVKPAAAKKPAASNPLADFFGGVVDWISESTLNMVIAIAGALVIVIALVVGIVAIAGAGDTGDIVKPE
ncbi:MAG: hypothetical protein GX683_03135, partial [Ruminococcaceae bacterium]|nr:hypothetical protein [Oscillospiraceae bacterium]